jgi:hypothetical protein
MLVSEDGDSYLGPLCHTVAILDSARLLCMDGNQLEGTQALKKRCSSVCQRPVGHEVPQAGEPAHLGST